MGLQADDMLDVERHMSDRPCLEMIVDNRGGEQVLWVGG